MKPFCDCVINGPRRILVTGHFGSGKTEFSVSLAFALADLMKKEDAPYRLQEEKVALADLDVENPYFRSRECRKELEEAGVKVYSDPFDGRNQSELQMISAAVLAPIQDPKCRVILDTGGDHTGAMILNQFSRHFGDDYQMLSIVNCNRPGTDSVSKAVAQICETEKATGLRVSGLISNAHLIRQTSVEDVINGFRFTKQVSGESGIPVLCACAADGIADRLLRMTECEKSKNGVSEMEIFRIGMYMRKSYLDK